jgi:hypothetical protein
MTKEQEKLLERNGWTVECESPLEISTEDGSFARGEAVFCVIHSLETEEAKEEFTKLNAMHDIIINGQPYRVPRRLSYGGVLALLGYPVTDIVSMTYHSRTSKASGCLKPGDAIDIDAGMIISAFYTGNA